jgi:hypothetical protein
MPVTCQERSTHEAITFIEVLYITTKALAAWLLQTFSETESPKKTLQYRVSRSQGEVNLLSINFELRQLLVTVYSISKNCMKPLRLVRASGSLLTLRSITKGLLVHRGTSNRSDLIRKTALPPRRDVMAEL